MYETRPSGAFFVRCAPLLPRNGCPPLTYTPWGVYTAGMEKKKGSGASGLSRRLAIIEGQVRGLREMVERGTYCIDIITQTSAVKQGLSNVEDILMERHLGSCVLRQVTAGQTEKAKAEILKVYRLKRK